MSNPEALSEKAAGNAAYKKKDFNTAIQHYNKAIEIEPTEITFRYARNKERDKEPDKWARCLVSVWDAHPRSNH